MSRNDELRARYADDMSVFAPPTLFLDHGRGARVWDVDGTEYLDFLAGIAVNSLGHAHPAFVRAVSEQAARLAHVSNLFGTEPQLALAERLRRLSGGSRVFFANSGTEANEAALKLARRTGRPRILALENAFHGRTMGALTLTGKPALHEGFHPLVPGIEHLPATLEALAAALAPGAGDDVAALIVEPIQGEAGVVPLPDGYLAEARRLTSQRGALLVIDEIQTGAGRTGAWFAFQHEGVVPDAITLAKGIGGGFPIGALVTFGDVGDLLRPGQHGTTFGGNPLATATADAVLAEIESAGLVARAAEAGERIRSAVTAIGSPLVTGLRGRGLLLGVALAEPVSAELVAAALEQGLIINAPNPTTIRLAPPLVVTDDDIDEFARRFAAALDVIHPTTLEGTRP